MFKSLKHVSMKIVIMSPGRTHCAFQPDNATE